MSSVNEQTKGTLTGSPAVVPGVAQAVNAMDQSKRVFLLRVRDQLLEPVNAIILFSEMLLAETRDLDQESFVSDLRKIHTSGKRLLDMIHQFFDPDSLAKQGEDIDLAFLQSRVRHDMLNALNPVINYCEMWLEDVEEQFLQGFLPDLEHIHRHGKQCLIVLDKVLKYKSTGAGEGESGDLPGGEISPEPIPELPDWEVQPKQLVASQPGVCLIVEDNEVNRDILCRLLIRQGHTVATAVNGRHALEMLQKQSFDLILLDIMMPEMNGFQVLQHLKADEKLREIPVIMISALDQSEGVIRCIAMGAEDYLPKPFNPLLLKARIGACLEKKRFRDKETLYLHQIEQEKHRSDELLRVILPREIVEELKTTDEVKPRRYENVAVLFADIVGFTPYCDRHGPEQVVPHLQSLVESWENSALRHDVEKIKTIGDAFMAACGLLKKVDNPVLNCIRCGLEMIAAAQSLSVGWNLRVGIHVGQVVAGVIGRRQYLFDLWGDTVNTAARMESHGKKGAIMLSRDAWLKVAHLARGEDHEIEVKGKGVLKTVRFCEFTTTATRLE